jgi:hypothetical protein
MRSLANVCIALGANPRQRPRLPEFGVTGSLRTFNAAPYAVWLSTAENGRTIARLSLKHILGHSRQTMRSWGKIAPVKVERNVARARATEPEDWLSIPRRETGRGFWRQGDYVIWQIPSTYSTAAQFQVGGRPSKAITKVKRALDNATGVSYRRMYWHDERACYQAINKGNVREDVYLRTSKTFGARRYRIWDHTYNAAERKRVMDRIHATERKET